MPRLWYPDEADVEEVASVLSSELFPGYESTTDFQLLGPEGERMLSSALGLVRQRYYRTVYDKAGALLRSLIKNHPYRDGNKRMGMTVTTVFLLMNGHFFLPTSEETVEYALRIASSEPDMSWQEIAAWIRGRTLPLRKDPDTALRQVMVTMPRTEDVQRRLLQRWDDIKRFVEGLP
ncbi:MAG: type II toxin-antitoxin system death-on-curing family toxin [Dehalococcoidia bacterium]|nr:type II toxin-antitoxin system death-on-curing family toxin [Dehalococcoidia bacterium]